MAHFRNQQYTWDFKQILCLLSYTKIDLRTMVTRGGHVRRSPRLSLSAITFPLALALALALTLKSGLSEFLAAVEIAGEEFAKNN